MGTNCSCLRSEDSVLRSCSMSTPLFSLNGTEHRARVVSVYDGDTIQCAIMLAGVPRRFRVRLDGIDCPEMKPPLKQAGRLVEQKAAKASRARLIEMIVDSTERRDNYSEAETTGLLLGTPLLVDLHCKAFDKYGRLLADVFPTDSDMSLSNQMVRERMAVRYDGGKKAPFVAVSLS
jgi:endonuclease YncB( thermonuclease family)